MKKGINVFTHRTKSEIYSFEFIEHNSIKNKKFRIVKKTYFSEILVNLNSENDDFEKINNKLSKILSKDVINFIKQGKTDEAKRYISIYLKVSLRKEGYYMLLDPIVEILSTIKNGKWIDE